MLPVNNRLSDRNDFQMVCQKGRFFSTNGVAIKFIEKSATETRIGFSIGKNFSKKAVERNRIRRILREAVHLELRKLRPGLDIVVFYRSSNKKPTLAEITKNFDYVFRKCNFYKQ